MLSFVCSPAPMEKSMNFYMCIEKYVWLLTNLIVVNCYLCIEKYEWLMVYLI